MSHDCELCGQLGAPAELVVFVPTDDTWTVNPSINVCRECEHDAVRYLEAQPCAAGPAQVDPLTYGAA